MSATEIYATALAVAAAITLSPGRAGAEPSAALAEGIASARAASGCPALTADPLATQAAELVNRATADYLEHTAQHPPISDPMTVLADLGSPATAAIQLQGAGRSAAESIKVTLLQGNSSIGYCGWRHIGTSVLTAGDRTIVVAVLSDG